MVGAIERARVAAVVGAQLRTAMRARIAHDVDAAIVGARHQHLVAAEVGAQEVVRLGDLALVGDEQPGAAENPLHLELENARIGVEAPMHHVGAHQFAQLALGNLGHRAAPTYLRFWHGGGILQP